MFCVRSVVVYGSETLAVKEEDLSKLERNDMMMRDRKSSDELRDELGKKVGRL